jgi:hypothetical protein
VDLTPQTPAQGISKNTEVPGYESYQVPCICGNPDDTIEFTVDNDDCEVTVSTYTLQRTPWWEDPFNRYRSYQIDNELLFQINYYVRGFLNALSHRLKITWSVWVRGYVEYSQTTIMKPQQALNYSETLRQAVQRVQTHQEQSQQEENGTL